MLMNFGFISLLQKVQKEPIPEEQEMDFRPVEEGEERSDSDSSHNEEAKEPDKTNRREGEKTDRAGAGESRFLFSCTPLNKNLPKFMYDYFVFQKLVRKFPRRHYHLLDQVPLPIISLRKQHSLRGKMNPKLNKWKRLKKRVGQKRVSQPRSPAEGMVCVGESGH